MRGFCPIAALAGLILGAAAPSPGAGQPDASPPAGLAAIERFADLPCLRASTVTSVAHAPHPVPARPPSGAPPQPAPAERTLAELAGPGCVTRLWCAGYGPDTRLRFYLDGEAQARADVLAGDLFAGASAPFLAPFCAGPAASGGGSVSYLPVPFRERLRITATGADFSSNVAAERFAAGTPVASWTGREDSSLAAAAWAASGDGARPLLGRRTERRVDLLPGRPVEALRLEGGGVITDLGVRIRAPRSTGGFGAHEPPPALDWRQVTLRITWDGDTTPAVEAPLDLLFGGGTQRASVRALPVTFVTDEGHCYLPMPFRSQARVELVGSVPVSGLEISAAVAPLPARWSSWGYLRTQLRSGDAARGRDWTFLEASGRGHLAGVVHDLGPLGAYFDGRERIYVNDSQTPAVSGTTLDAFYGAADSFLRGSFSLPASGHPLHGARCTAYRFFFPDTVPFTRSIRAGLQHGSRNTAPARFTTLSFYYSQPEVASVLTDSLDVGDPESERAHHYTATDAEELPAFQGQYDNVGPDVQLIDGGRRVRGSSEMTLKLDRAYHGALLRRRLDHTVPDQEARIFVDGSPAGTWLTPGRGTQFRCRDEDFPIPASLTRGKTQIRVRVEPLARNGQSPWTECAWWVYSLR